MFGCSLSRRKTMASLLRLERSMGGGPRTLPSHQIKALAHRFTKDGAVDLWNQDDGPLTVDSTSSRCVSPVIKDAGPVLCASARSAANLTKSRCFSTSVFGSGMHFNSTHRCLVSMNFNFNFNCMINLRYYSMGIQTQKMPKKVSFIRNESSESEDEDSVQQGGLTKSDRYPIFAGRRFEGKDSMVKAKTGTGKSVAFMAEDDDDEEEDEGESEFDDDDELKSAEEIEEEAADIGYKVIGQIQDSDRPFKQYEPIFAVVQIGPHQFKVSNGDTISTERLKYCDVNDKLILNKVLMLGSTSQTIIGRPILPDASVHAIVEEHALDAKVLIFKKKRRKNYRRTRGHRQELTRLRIIDIQGIQKPETPEPKKPKYTSKKVEKVAVAA